MEIGLRHETFANVFPLPVGRALRDTAVRLQVLRPQACTRLSWFSVAIERSFPSRLNRISGSNGRQQSVAARWDSRIAASVGRIAGHEAKTLWVIAEIIQYAKSQMLLCHLQSSR
jgi:hypothetical protein